MDPSQMNLMARHAREFVEVSFSEETVIGAYMARFEVTDTRISISNTTTYQD